MIQSVKFDSSNMDIKKIANSVLTFIIKRLIEISIPTISRNLFNIKVNALLVIFFIFILDESIFHFVSSNFYC